MRIIGVYVTWEFPSIINKTNCITALRVMSTFLYTFQKNKIEETIRFSRFFPKNMTVIKIADFDELLIRTLKCERNRKTIDVEGNKSLLS